MCSQWVMCDILHCTCIHTIPYLYFKWRWYISRAPMEIIDNPLNDIPFYGKPWKEELWDLPFKWFRMNNVLSHPSLLKMVKCKWQNGDLLTVSSILKILILGMIMWNVKMNQVSASSVVRWKQNAKFQGIEFSWRKLMTIACYYSDYQL